MNKFGFSFRALDEVEIQVTDDSFSLLEYVYMGLGSKKYYPLERLDITFNDNGSYTMNSELVFEPPRYETKDLFHVYNTNNTLLQLMKQKDSIDPATKGRFKAIARHLFDMLSQWF